MLQTIGYHAVEDLQDDAQEIAVNLQLLVHRIASFPVPRFFAQPQVPASGCQPLETNMVGSKGTRLFQQHCPEGALFAVPKPILLMMTITASYNQRHLLVPWKGPLLSLLAPHLLQSISKSEMIRWAACDDRLLMLGARFANAARVLVWRYTSFNLLRL